MPSGIGLFVCRLRGLSLLEHLKQFRALETARRIGVAVSGGADSVALAHLAVRAFAGRVVLLHVNYGLRGAESDADEALVRQYGEQWGCECIFRRVTPEGDSEDELRRLRYEWFASCPVDAVLTGHTRDDQAETVLFRLVRGTGPGGLTGILPENGRVFRPLLECTRATLVEYLTQEGIAWREDRSNQDLKYRRNWIRHRLLPELAENLNPSVSRVVAQMAELAQADEAWIEPHVEALLDAMAEPEGEAWILDVARFREQPLGLRRRLLRRLMERAKGNRAGIDFGHVEGAIGLCDEMDGNGRIQVPELDLMRSFGWLRVVRLEVLRALPDRNWRRELPVPGDLAVPEGAGKVVTSLVTGCNYNEVGRSLDWGKLTEAVAGENRLELRNWRPGDLYARAGSEHPEKVKDLFQKHRIPLWRRRSWPIVVLGDLPVWVAEFGPAAEYAAGPETQTALQVVWSPVWKA